jgi:hypothetical protein
VRDWDGAAVALPPGVEGRWRDVLTGTEHDLRSGAPVAPLVEAHGVGLLERAG